MASDENDNDRDDDYADDDDDDELMMTRMIIIVRAGWPGGRAIIFHFFPPQSQLPGTPCPFLASTADDDEVGVENKEGRCFVSF